MLRSPTGATIAAMMAVTGWQQHSVRGFLAGVVRKRLKLKLGSKKIDGNRVYQIAAERAASPGLASPRASRPERHAARQRSVRPCRTGRPSTSRLRACAISTSGSFRAVGIPYSGGERPLTCPATCCFAFWLTGSRPMCWVIWRREPALARPFGVSRGRRATCRGAEPSARRT